MLLLRHLCDGEKRGRKVGKTKLSKRTKLMTIADAIGLPLAVRSDFASLHKIILVQATIDETVTWGSPKQLVENRAYDSDPRDDNLVLGGIELIAPHRVGRIRRGTQDGRKLRCYKKRLRA